MAVYIWAALEQMSNGYQFSPLKDEQMRNKVGIENLAVFCLLGLKTVQHHGSCEGVCLFLPVTGICIWRFLQYMGLGDDLANLMECLDTLPEI